MKLYLIETILGVFAVDEENNVRARQLYPNDRRTIVKILNWLAEGRFDYLEELVKELEQAEKVYSHNKRLVESLSHRLNIEYRNTITEGNRFKEGLPEYAVELGLIENPQDYYDFNYTVSKELTHRAVHEALSSREALLIPAVQLLNELDTVLNGLSGRMREWYGVHFPEMGRRVKSHEDYANVIKRLGNRENLTTDALMKLTLKKKDAIRIEDAAERSMGANFEEYDINMVQSYADRVLDMHKFREELSDYISTVTTEIAPNVAYLAGPVLAAKLIDRAGGLKRLAMIASSTIQVIGAEKALFRAKKTNARPPKHGLLFLHPYVNSASRKNRGRRARSLAAKIAIAARADLFSGNYIAEDLAAQLDDF